MRKPAFLKNLKVTRVDLVGKGANQDQDGSGAGSHVVLFKSADEEDDTRSVLQKILDAVTKNRHPEDKTMPKVEKTIDQMTPEELQAYAKGLEESVETLTASQTDLTGQVTTLTAKVADLEKAAPKETDPPDPNQTVLKGLSPEAQELFKAQEATNKALTDKLEVETNARLEKQYKDEAAAFEFLPATAEDIAKVLRQADEHVEKGTADSLRDILTRTNAMLAESKLFEKFSVKETEEQTATSKLEKAAEEIRKGQPDLSKEQAFSKAIEANPELAQQMRAES